MSFSSELNWGSYIISITITASKKIGALIRSVKFRSPEVTLYLFKSTIKPCMEYFCHVWAGAPSCYLELLDKLQKWMCQTAGTSLAASFEPLAHCQNVANWSLFSSITLVDVHTNWFDWFHIIIEGGLLVILSYKDVSLTSFLLYELDSGMICL